MRKHLPTLCIWSLAYMALIAAGAHIGLQPIVDFATLILLGLPPFICCMRAGRKVINRTKFGFPHEWAFLNVNSDWLHLELRRFIFDDRAFGDETIAAWKRELRWWSRVGMIAIVLVVPTLLLVEKLSK